jgi:hypothetical protein
MSGISSMMLSLRPLETFSRKREQTPFVGVFHRVWLDAEACDCQTQCQQEASNTYRSIQAGMLLPSLRSLPRACTRKVDGHSDSPSLSRLVDRSKVNTRRWNTMERMLSTVVNHGEQCKPVDARPVDDCPLPYGKKESNNLCRYTSASGRSRCLV